MRGVKSKATILLNTSTASAYSVIAITETWLDNSINNEEIFDCNRYTVYRCDRDFENTHYSRGGGVAIAIDSTLFTLDLKLKSSTQFKDLHFIDILGVKVNMNFSVCYLIVIYIPPNMPVDCYNSIYEILSSLVYLYNSEIILIGDFNITEYSDSLSNNAITTNCTEALADFCNFFDFQQYNFVKNYNNRLLDLVLSNNVCNVERATDNLLPEDQHHPALILSTDAFVNKDDSRKCLKEKKIFHNYRKANLVGLYQSLATVDWDFLMNVTNMNEAYDLFYQKIFEVINVFVSKITVTFKRDFPPWYNSNIIRYLKLKYSAWKDYKKNNDLLALEEFKLLRQYIKNQIDDAYKQYCKNVEANIHNEPKKFWQFINNKTRSNSMPSIMFHGDSELAKTKNIVNAFAEYFQSAYTTPANTPLNDYGNMNSDVLHVMQFSEQEVIKALKKLKAKTTMGPDEIPSFLLRDCAIILAKPIAFLFNFALKENIFPDVLKISKVIPIYKKDDKRRIENYRPITIINNLSKAFEFLLHEPLYAYVKTKLTEYQHGFVKGRSTSTNLCCITQYISDAFKDNTQVDVIYTDFSKAFDKLDHDIILNKLAFLGFSEDLQTFFASYLRNRSLYVECLGTKSPHFTATSGVPQGSVLGPLFFNLFINDIVSDIDLPCLLYADDLKLFSRVNNAYDCSSLQAALTKIEMWCKTNNLQLNINKCFVITYSNKRNNLVFNYTLDDSEITRCSYIRDLGVTFDAKMSFSLHIQNISKDAFKILGFIIRNSREFSNIDSLKLLYGAYIRAKLEYGSIAWSPFYNAHVNALEKVQRRFLKFLAFKVDGIYPPIGFPHNELLEKFSVDSLENRRQISDVMFVYKIINGEVDCSDILIRLNFHIPRLASRQNATFFLPTSRTNIHNYSPLVRMCRNCNKAASHIDIFSCSKRSIKKLTLA